MSGEGDGGGRENETSSKLARRISHPELTLGVGLRAQESTGETPGLWVSVHVCVHICASLGAEHVCQADFCRLQMEQQMEGWCNQFLKLNQTV